MTLFDTDVQHAPIAHEGMAMPGFNFLNRSNHPDVKRARELLESWFAAYPAAEQPDLRSRFRSASRSQHQPAFFELFLHALVRRLGCRVEIHPTLATSRSHPDFFVHEPANGSFYLEARVALNETREEAGVRDQLDELYGRVAGLSSPDFFVNITSVKRGSSAVPGSNRVKRFLTEQLRAASWEAAQNHLAAGLGLTMLPRWQYREEDWIIEFLAIPKSEAQRGRENNSSIGGKMEGAVWRDPRTAIVEAVEAKSAKYGTLDHPLVVAVNCLEEADENLDVFTAFYGTEHWTVDFGSEAARFDGFNRDGVWMGKGGPQNLRVSAVLVGFPIYPWNLARAPLCLYLHPFARKPYTGVLTCLPLVRYESGKTIRKSGMKLAEVFDLPADWPRGSR